MKRVFSKEESAFADLFRTDGIDFDAAREMLAGGVDINACETDEDGSLDETLLTESLCGVLPGINRYFNEEDAETRKAKGITVRDFMARTVSFFLENGYDVRRENGWYGAVALAEISYCAYPRYLADVVKMLIDAGARDGVVYQDDGSTALGMLGSILSDKVVLEGDSCGAMEGEALYRILERAEKGLPYKGVDNYRMIVGKRMTRVLTDGEGTLYLCYDGGAFVLDKKSFVAFTDTFVPENLTDVSGKYQSALSKKCAGVDVFLINRPKGSRIKLIFEDGSALLFEDGT